MKKIAMIIQHLTNGGAERTISNLSMILKDKYDIYIIVFDGKNVTYPYNGTLIDLNLPPKQGFVNKLINTWKRIKAVKKIKKQHKFDCVISFMFGANLVNVLSGRKCKTIISERNYLSAYGTGFREKLCERFVASRADIIVALSKMVESDLQETFKVDKNKTITIYNPCDIERIQGLAQKNCNFEFDPNSYYFVSAGRMVEQKGHWHILKAFAETKKKAPNVKLILLGSGKFESNIKELSRALGIENDIICTGFIENPYAYISRCNCFVLSSLFEGLGNVILEAMACNVPVVSYDCLAGPRELIAPETDVKARASEIEICSCGILVPLVSHSVDWSVSISQDDINLSNAMYKVYNDTNLSSQLVNNATKRLGEFTNERIVDQWVDII